MNKILKFLLIGIVAICILVGVVVFVVISRLDGIVVAAVEKIGSETLGTPVTLAGANISLREGSGGLHGLKIANPQGFSDGNAFELDEISVNLEIGSLGSDEIVIESIVVDGARVLFEEIGGEINLQKLVPQGGEVAGQEDQPGENAETPKLVIKEFRFTNAQASMSSEKLDSDMTVPIPDIILHDIGKKGAGLTAAEASNQLLEPLIQKVLEGAQGEMVDQLKQKATSRIMDALSGRKKQE